MSIPFDADWRRLCTASDTPAVVAHWGILERTLAGEDLDGLRCRGRSHNPAVSDPVLAALLRLGATDVMARRVIVEALMGRLLPVAAGLARRNGDPYDDVLAELAGWAWELVATTAHDRWETHLAPNLARLAKRRYLAAHTRRPAERLEDGDIPAVAGHLDDHLGACDVAILLRRAVTTGTVTATGAEIVATMISIGGTDTVIAAHLGRTPASTKKARERVLAQLRNWTPVAALRAA